MKKIILLLFLKQIYAFIVEEAIIQIGLQKKEINEIYSKSNTKWEKNNKANKSVSTINSFILEFNIENQKKKNNIPYDKNKYKELRNGILALIYCHNYFYIPFVKIKYT
jgi:dsDNA-specific endonuclease/ATPase MutS2